MLRKLWQDNFLVSSMLFFPTRAHAGGSALADTQDGVVPLGEVTIGYRLYSKADAVALFLLFHGNAESAADYDVYASFLRSIGVALLVVDYRGYGWSSGHPRASALLSDAEHVLLQLPDLLIAHGMEELPLFVVGCSLGGAPAIHLANKYPHCFSGLILESTFAHAPSVLGRAFAWMPGLFGNKDKMAGMNLPLLVMHGERDQIIPVRQGQTLFDTAPAQHKVLMRVPQAGHNDLVATASTDYFVTVKTFVDDVLNAKS